MTRDIIDFNDFTIIIESLSEQALTLDSCAFEEPLIAVVFYGSGNVSLEVQFGEKNLEYHHTQGLALSFFANEQVKFIHEVSFDRPLESIVVATAIDTLQKLPYQEGEIFSDLLAQLVNPADHYVEGPSFYMTPEMQQIVKQVFHNKYKGKTKMMFYRSQITALLSHFFGQLAMQDQKSVNEMEREKLYEAEKILKANLDSPPSLNELSKLIGLNTFKLKKNFKELFGVPVFKYLQNERLSKAHELLQTGKSSIQEAAWHVGYDSLSSFSNAFVKKFGMRPSEIKR